jgi:hypothetical protein
MKSFTAGLADPAKRLPEPRCGAIHDMLHPQGHAAARGVDQVHRYRLVILEDDLPLAQSVASREKTRHSRKSQSALNRLELCALLPQSAYGLQYVESLAGKESGLDFVVMVLTEESMWG